MAASAPAPRPAKQRQGSLVLAASILAGAVGAFAVVAADAQGVLWHPAASARAAPGHAIGADDVALALVRTTLASLNDANRTGNYEVLRALAAPEFAARNPAAALATTFEGFRRAGIDLAAVAVMQPVLDGPPRQDGAGRLLIAGRFPGEPIGVVFDLAFSDVGGRWRLHTVAVRTEASPRQHHVGGAGAGRGRAG